MCNRSGLFVDVGHISQRRLINRLEIRWETRRLFPLTASPEHSGKACSPLVFCVMQIVWNNMH